MVHYVFPGPLILTPPSKDNSHPSHPPTSRKKIQTRWASKKNGSDFPWQLTETLQPSTVNLQPTEPSTQPNLQKNLQTEKINQTSQTAKIDRLVGGWTNPSEKYARQNGNLPQFCGVKTKKCLKPPPSRVCEGKLGVVFELKIVNLQFLGSQHSSELVLVQLVARVARVAAAAALMPWNGEVGPGAKLTGGSQNFPEISFKESPNCLVFIQFFLHAKCMVNNLKKTKWQL